MPRKMKGKHRKPIYHRIWDYDNREVILVKPQYRYPNSLFCWECGVWHIWLIKVVHQRTKKTVYVCEKCLKTAIFSYKYKIYKKYKPFKTILECNLPKKWNELFKIELKTEVL